MRLILRYGSAPLGLFSSITSLKLEAICNSDSCTVRWSLCSSGTIHSPASKKWPAVQLIGSAMCLVALFLILGRRILLPVKA